MYSHCVCVCVRALSSVWLTPDTVSSRFCITLAKHTVILSFCKKSYGEACYRREESGFVLSNSRMDAQTVKHNVTRSQHSPQARPLFGYFSHLELTQNTFSWSDSNFLPSFSWTANALVWLNWTRSLNTPLDRRRIPELKWVKKERSSFHVKRNFLF